MPPALKTRATSGSGAQFLGAPDWSGVRSKRIRVGISGWIYPPWRGSFYPRGLRQDGELAYASRRLNSIEVNGTFYSLMRPEAYQSWYEQTPAGFLFSLKGPR